ncbi:MAG: peptide deformylase [Candidatus Daviesbacteria bacterium]|nr:peptide deformylase [Candidatus Daviesbacteria bacterium]
MQILRAPDPKLRIKTKLVKKITPELLKIAREMIELAMSYTDPEGVGLSTTQIGRDERFFVAKLLKEFHPYFNPQIISKSPKLKTYFEGCLSVPDYYGEVKRSILITVIYQDKTGKEFKKILKGPSAWIFQHEFDHINGVLFVDRVLEQKGRMFKFTGKDQVGGDMFEEVTL